ncbi:MAG: hypothetical protein ABII90_06875 [Bacteroidota bacterium]
MKQSILYLILFVLICSCTEVWFAEPQPPGTGSEKMFPGNLQGSYVDKNNDTLVINDISFRYEDYKEGELSENLILKKGGNYYFLNERRDSLWRLLVGEVKGNDLLLWAIDGDNAVKIEMLKKITNVKEVYSTSDTGKIEGYIINPGKAELERMLSEGVFSEKARFNKIKF